jgi:N utilization substance protein B
MRGPASARLDIKARSTARLAAVQALYQMELSGTGADAVVAEFVDHRFERVAEEPVDDEPHGGLGAADEPFFADIVKGVVADQATIDNAIAKRLAAGWKLTRLDATVRATLRAGAWELHRRPDVPTEVVIDEYVELAKGFTDDAGFVNAALDAMARDLRP